MSTFEGLNTVREIDARYKDMFGELRDSLDFESIFELQDIHRKALETLAHINEHVPADDDPNKINPRLIRNWAAQEGLSLAKKGRVSLDIENAYRREHDLPVLVEDKPVRISVDASPSEVRAWAADNDIECGVRGRLNPAVLVAYAKAHPTE